MLTVQLNPNGIIINAHAVWLCLEKYQDIFSRTRTSEGLFSSILVEFVGFLLFLSLEPGRIRRHLASLVSSLGAL